MQTCPNCGTECSTKFCPQCGQTQHVHKETFWHLLTHFIGHYFHYDSKFWLTIKTLCFYPGKLSLAYHRLQRTKYISPVNLYIFVSIVFFLFFSKAFNILVTSGESGNQFVIHWQKGTEVSESQHKDLTMYLQVDEDSIQQKAQELIAAKQEMNQFIDTSKFSLNSTYLLDFGGHLLVNYMYHHAVLDPIQAMNEMFNKFLNIIPKVFFLLMPLFSLLLYIMFLKKRNYHFVDHGVMSLHMHTLIFLSLMLFFLLSYLYVPDLVYTVFTFGFVLPGSYFLIACKRFYQCSWGYAVLAGSLVWTLYFLLVLLVTAGSFIFAVTYL